MSPGLEASAAVIALSYDDTKGIFSNPFTAPSEEIARQTSSLLNKNHREFHIYFNDRGFHNHIVHHLLSLYALNADLAKMRSAFERDASYQRSLPAAQADIVVDMQRSRDSILKYLPGDELQVVNEDEFGGKQYSNFLEFWRAELEKWGVKGVLGEWVFKGDKVAEKILGRLFSGFIHPYIHAGFALEFHQPAILAEALAEASVHENWVYPLIEGSETKASELKVSNVPPRPLVDLLVEAGRTAKLRNAPHYDDGNKLRDGVLTRASDEFIELASQWFIPPHPTWDLANEKIAEHIHAAFLFTATAAFHTTTKSNGTRFHHVPKLDFFYIHSTNGSIFFTSFARDEKVKSTLGLTNIIRLLEIKARVDLGMYISRGSPPITPETINQIRTYQPFNTAERGTGWARVFERIINNENDDSHAVKFIRALANAERECQVYQDRDWCVIKGDMWLRIAWMALDSFQSQPDFVRNAGWDEAWKDVAEWK